MDFYCKFWRCSSWRWREFAQSAPKSSTQVWRHNRSANDAHANFGQLKLVRPAVAILDASKRGEGEAEMRRGKKGGGRRRRRRTGSPFEVTKFYLSLLGAVR